jgi:alpha-tubulin suppressor-like RCC1 family protein
MLRELADKTWDFVAAGSNHSAAISEEGELFTWGNGACGRLGHGSIGDEPKPKVGFSDANNLLSRSLKALSILVVGIQK